jgi:hypothetical protein
MKMKVKEIAKNEAINLQADALTDLPVTDEQADRARGGIDQQGRLLIGTEGGLWR